ncbi:M24 family metallopeptidase, partial [Candidatus Saccharibacteria bacterium]|nr:M24 family metallopeptidase [Candidatus Saccharibacteria bacterium]
ISAVKDTATIKDISKNIERVLKGANLGIVKEFVGHGVGHRLHEEPNIPNYVNGSLSFELLEGMTIAIEPMAILGGEAVFIDNDGWTVKTKNDDMSAHFEDTILVTKSGFEILTRN